MNDTQQKVRLPPISNIIGDRYGTYPAYSAQPQTYGYEWRPQLPPLYQGWPGGLRGAISTAAPAVSHGTTLQAQPATSMRYQTGPSVSAVTPPSVGSGSNINSPLMAPVSVAVTAPSPPAGALTPNSMTPGSVGAGSPVGPTSTSTSTSHGVGKPAPKRKTRNNLPKETTYILIKWLDEHLQHPYPNSFEKNQLMMSTGLNQQQLLNWFINARRRKIKMLKERQQQQHQQQHQQQLQR